MSKANTNQPQARNTLDSIAIIMDGNGRWATRRGLSRSHGHIAGAQNLGNVIRELRPLGIHHLTLYAFSTENWKRPADEVEQLMELIYKYIDEKVIDLIKKDPDLCIKFIGDKSALPEKLRNKCIEAESLPTNRKFILNIALNYGGRDEIVNAANMAIKDGHTELTEQILSKYMYTCDSPDPDLVIRTGGDFRISNFLLWQSAYSEFVITDTLWPDFGKDDIEKCIAEYNSRHRRFGGLDPEDMESEEEKH